MKEKVIEGFNNDKGFIKHNNYKIVDLSEDECIMEYDVVEEGMNPINMVHGGMLFGLADTAAGMVACMREKYPVTTNASIHYLNAAKCKKVIAKASALKVGNKIGYFRVDVFDENDTILCTCNVEMYLK